jgi:hypothetical protein
MSSSSRYQAGLAKAPFDDSRADLIVWSSDIVNFRVFKGIFSHISLGFADKFNTAQPASRGLNSSDELPIITVSKDSEELDLALRHCYPARSSELEDPHVLLKFGQKYRVDALEPSLTV